MGIEKNRILSERRRIVKAPTAGKNGEVEFIDLAIWHKPMTPNVTAEVDEIGDEPGNDDGEEQKEPSAPDDKPVIVRKLAFLLTRWDVIEDGAPLAPTEEVLSEFEYEFLHAIYAAILEPLYPKSTT